MEKVTILKNNVDILEAAFEGCTALKEMDLSNCRDICDRSFLNCTDLRNVCFPDRLWSLGDNVFQGCPNLEEFSVHENKNIENNWFTTLLTVNDGVLYSRKIKDEDIFDNDGEYIGYRYCAYKLSLYPAGKRNTSFVMPDVTFEGVTSKVTEIAGGAFANYYADSTWQPFTQADGVEEVTQDEIKVTSRGVEAPDGVRVEIYTMAGHLAARGIGSYSFDLAPGIYIVRTPDSVRKISIM